MGWHHTAMPAGTVDERREIELSGGSVGYTLRRSPRSRGLRVTVDPRRGVVVSVPVATRRGWSDPRREVERFLREREAWVQRHVARLERERAQVAARGGLVDGATLRYRGSLHRLRIEAPRPGRARTTVERAGTDAGDEVIVRLGSRDRRSVAAVLEAWFRDRAATAIDEAIDRHAGALQVRPSAIALRDPATRWGSASRKGRLMFSWRLVLAPPEVLETVVVHELAHLRVFGHGPRFWATVASRVPEHEERRRWLRRHAHELHAALEES
jgi:predicted metal-dependent hydrolase